jgi:hypothetical protein
MKTLRTCALLAAAAALATAPGAAFAQAARVKAGMLTCSVAPGKSFVFGSTRELNCVFTANDGATERYIGEISRYGVDIGFTNAATMMWSVVAGQAKFAPGSLTGTYGGAAAGTATPAAGGAINALVGGSRNSIMLQSVSVENTTGWNLAFGVAELKLVKSGPR